ncbi:MAG TPA: lamin tail domain-containing protein [Dermatophilaceae bacterium]|nr:lamin tail domain-containing protein [Dermatophilaceae bacterium]
MDRRDGRAGRDAPSARHRTVVAAAVGALLLGALTPFAAPSTAITPQAEQTWETGVIQGVADGDTVLVEIRTAADPGFIAPAASPDPALPSARSYCLDRLNTDGTMPTDDNDLDGCRVRLSGIQAPEKAGAAGGSALPQCRADAATDALRAVLPKGTPVQLRSISVRSVENDYSEGRLARSVYYEASPGTWVDAGRAVLAGGHAMWFPHSVADSEKPEYTHNLEYRRLVDDAAARGAGLWSAGYCGPSVPAAVRTWVVSDPIGDDAGREYVVVLNDSDAALDVSGWAVRDSSLTTVTLPPGTVIGPRDHLRIFTGSGAPGTPTPRDFHFGGPTQMFANWDPAAGYFYGDGAYVYDAQPGFAYGNLRAWFHYPCDPAACGDPLVGRVVIGAVQYDPPGADTAAGEFIEFRNTTGAPVSLGGYAFTRQGSQYAFPPATAIQPGGTLRLSMGAGIDTADTLFLGWPSSLLTNTGDHLMLANLNHAPVDCRAWGAFSCAGSPVSGPLAGPVVAAVPAAAPAPAPVAAAPTKRPGAPTAVRATAKSKRVTVRWSAPVPNGTKKVTKYRAKVYLSSGKAMKYRTSCTAKPRTLKCRTKKLLKGRTYVVKVQARNAKGYGAFSAPVTVRVR